MAKRNLNEILGFISRWGDSDFSLNLLDESLTSAALEKAAMMAEKDKPTSIRAKQLRARGIKRLADEKKLEAIIKDKSPQNQAKREKALRIRDKMTSFEDTDFDPKLTGQVTGKGSQKPVTVGGKRQTLQKTQPAAQNQQQAQPAAQNQQQAQPAAQKQKQAQQAAKKPMGRKSIGGQILSGIGKTASFAGTALSLGSGVLDTAGDIASTLIGPAGQGREAQLMRDFGTTLRSLGGQKVTRDRDLLNLLSRAMQQQRIK